MTSMATIEQRVEASGIVSPDYSGRVFSEADIAKGKHRAFVGGVWDTHGEHQLNFLLAQGLQPGDRFLDIGCGSLARRPAPGERPRPGALLRHRCQSLVDPGGLRRRVDDEQRSRLPASNLRANDRFDGDFGVKFDMAIAQSVFSHVSLNHIRLCLYRTARVMRPGGNSTPLLRAASPARRWTASSSDAREAVPTSRSRTCTGTTRLTSSGQRGSPVDVPLHRRMGAPRWATDGRVHAAARPRARSNSPSGPGANVPSPGHAIRGPPGRLAVAVQPAQAGGRDRGLRTPAAPDLRAGRLIRRAVHGPSAPIWVRSRFRG